MDIITIDFETYWASDYTLSKMSPLEYVMGDRYETISCAIKVNHYPTDVFYGDAAIAKAFDSIAGRVANGALLGHNMLGFDSYICAYRFGLKPKMWLDTAAMARPLHAKTCGVSLAKLVEHYKLGVKDNSVLLSTKGKYLKDFTEEELELMKVYNRADTDQCYALFKVLRGTISAQELWQIDAMTRMRVEPAFELDVPMLETALSIERDKKLQSLLKLAKLLGVSHFDAEGNERDQDAVVEEVRAQMASAAKFSAILEAEGVEVPTKPSPSNPESGKMVPALAKSDEAFIALQEHDNPIVAEAARVRLEVKSTLLETRIEKFLTAGQLAGGKLPVPLRYCGADTTGRDSGEEYNPQNMPRIDPKKPKHSDALRNCLRAPRGYSVIVADQSGIELRVNHFLWKVQSSMDLYWADKDADLYKAFAAAMYQKQVEDVTKSERQLAKVAQLGLGFGAGAPTFQRVAKTMGGLDLSLADAEATVYRWRSTYADIVSGWKSCHAALLDIYDGREAAIDPWNMLITSKEGIHLPSKRVIRYPDLRQETNEASGKQEWVYAHGRHKARIYAGKITENCIAEGTLVLTDRGWVPIEAVELDDQVHDGVEFVRHAGSVSKLVQSCVSIDGVYMTPDHEVLTNEGWKIASQKPEPYRPVIRGTNGCEPRAQRREETVLEVPVPVREAVRESWKRGSQGNKARGDSELRVHDAHADRTWQCNTRDVEASGLRGLPKHGRQVQVALTSGMEKLWRTGHNSLRALGAVVHQFLGGHGRLVHQGAGAGPKRQQWDVFAGELSLDNKTGKYHEQERHGANRGRSKTERGNGYRKNNTVQPDQIGLACSITGGETELRKQVFDILNCGPRHRFVVRGASGPFIVHNCVQALARDSIFDCSLDFYKSTGLRPALRVHDELVYVVPEAQATDMLAELQRIMGQPPKWWPELVVSSAGDVAQTYGAAK